MGTSKLMIAAIAAAVATPSTAQAAGVPATTNSGGRTLILVPLTLTKVQDLDFGTVIPSSATSGVVTINAVTGARTFGGGVTGVSTAAGNRAQFAGAGSPSQQVILALSPPTQLTSPGGDTVDLLGLTLDGPPIRSIDPTTRAFFVGIGGTLLIGQDQPAGDYSADFSLTAVYQ